MLKPGPNGWELYGKLVAEAYKSAPSYDPEAASSFEDLGPFTDKMYKQILHKKIMILYEALGWDEPTDATKTIERFF